MAASRIRSLSPRYLDVPSVYLVQFSIYGWIRKPKPMVFRVPSTSGHRPGKCKAQRSTFNSPWLSISIPDPFWHSASHSDASSRPYLSLILLTLCPILLLLLLLLHSTSLFRLLYCLESLHRGCIPFPFLIET